MCMIVGSVALIESDIFLVAFLFFTTVSFDYDDQLSSIAESTIAVAACPLLSMATTFI